MSYLDVAGRVIKARAWDVSDSGRAYNLANELLGLAAGQRITEVNVEAALGFKASKFSRDASRIRISGPLGDGTLKSPPRVFASGVHRFTASSAILPPSSLASLTPRVIFRPSRSPMPTNTQTTPFDNTTCLRDKSTHRFYCIIPTVPEKLARRRSKRTLAGLKRG